MTTATLIILVFLMITGQNAAGKPVRVVEEVVGVSRCSGSSWAWTTSSAESNFNGLRLRTSAYFTLPTSYSGARSVMGILITCTDPHMSESEVSYRPASSSDSQRIIHRLKSFSRQSPPLTHDWRAGFGWSGLRVDGISLRKRPLIVLIRPLMCLSMAWCL